MGKRKLAKVIEVDKARCVDCHTCILACPVKYCNDASGKGVLINDDTCIGCGSCVKACTHGARRIVDDSERFFADLHKGVKMVAIVAPAVAPNFPNEYLNLNGWLKSIGVEAVFDVSFGAELTIVSYLKHLEENHPKTVISQPCPALVSFIELYKPELIPYLAPADSPMAHTMKMIREYYPAYRNHKIAAISPCTAKRREFDEISLGEYNVTFVSLSEHFKDKEIRLKSFPESDYDNPPAERAVLFSTPGGLLKTAERWSGDVQSIARKIEGPEIVYDYFEKLPEVIRQGQAPVIIDCLNCGMGCNGGNATLCKEKSPDELEFLVEQRKHEMQARHRKAGLWSGRRSKRAIEKLVNSFWKPRLYDRTYENLSNNNAVKIPSESQMWEIFRRLGKTSQANVYNCSACGYLTCKGMATAIFNGLNRPENCHHFIADQIKAAHLEAEARAEQAAASAKQLQSAESANRAMLAKHNVLKQELSQSILTRLSKLSDTSSNQASDFKVLVEEVRQLASITEEFKPIVTAISEIASSMHLLALNATIEAAHAGEAGKGFSIVAEEVKYLASNSKSEAEKISPYAQQLREAFEMIIQKVRDASETLSRTNELTAEVTNFTEEIGRTDFERLH